MSRRCREPSIQIVEEGDVVVDIGANAGFFTVLLGTLAGPGGRVISFEPGAANIQRLKNNIKLNELANVNLVEQPASHTGKEITFYINSDDSGGNALWDVGTYPTNLEECGPPDQADNESNHSRRRIRKAAAANTETHQD